MADFSPTSAPLPGFLASMIASVARHALTGAASALVAHGVFMSTQANEFVDLGGAFVLYAAGLWWSGIQKKNVAVAIAGR